MANRDAGKIGITTEGAWSSSTTYEYNSIVNYNNESWISKKASTGITPGTDDTAWMRFGSYVSIDSELSTSSENPAQNKVLTLALNSKVSAGGDTASNVVGFTSGDTASAGSWTDVNVIATGETHSSLFNKLSNMAKNVRFLWGLMGNTDISAIGDGKITGAISSLNGEIDSKQASITGGASTITSSNLTASKALMSDVNGKVGASAVTSTELSYLTGVTSSLQTQLNSKQASSSAVNKDNLATYSGGSTWATSKSYAFNDIVLYSNVAYICTVAHTSSSSNTPGSTGGGSYWSAISLSTLNTSLTNLDNKIINSNNVPFSQCTNVRSGLSSNSFALYKKNGLTVLSFTISSAEAQTWDNPLFRLPSGYAPKVNLYTPVRLLNSSVASGYICIFTNGDVRTEGITSGVHIIASVTF